MTGDPYCPIHGMMPCRCHELRQYGIDPFAPRYFVPMNDFTVLHGDELDKLRKLEGFYMAVQGLVETTEQFHADNVSLSYLKTMLKDYNPDSN